MTILVTGAAGFIGAALSRFLLDRGDDVIGVYDLNHYYDVNLKKDRLEGLVTSSGFTFDQLDISDRSIVSELFSTREFSVVVHLAAQAGVRYSIENPSAWDDAYGVIRVIWVFVGLPYFLIRIVRPRLHDMEMNAWFGLLLLIPLINLVIFLALMLAPGQARAE